MSKAIDKFKKHHDEMKNDLVSETTKELVDGIMKLRLELMDLVETKDDVLKIEYKEDQKIVDEGMKELQRLHKEVPKEFKTKLDKVIKFMNELPSDIFYNVTRTVFTTDPNIEDLSTEKQLHNLNCHFYIQNYIWSDKIKGQSKKNTYNKTLEVVKEIEAAGKENEQSNEAEES